MEDKKQKYAELLKDARWAERAREIKEWNTGNKDFSEEKAFDGEYYDDIREYKREFGID